MTSGSSLAAIVVVTDATGAEVYREGPMRPSYRDDGGEDEEPAGEGVFRFYCEMAGPVRVGVTNPSSSEPITVTLAWLKGRDDDDPFTAGGGEPSWDDELEGGDVHGDALIANPRNASAFALRMLGRVSSLHKSIDGLVAQQAYMGVLARRHSGTMERVHGKVVRATLLEAAVIVMAAVLQVVLIRRFNFAAPGGKGGGFHTYSSVV